MVEAMLRHCFTQERGASRRKRYGRNGYVQVLSLERTGIDWNFNWTAWFIRMEVDCSSRACAEDGPVMVPLGALADE